MPIVVAQQPLTPRQAQILQYLADGKTQSQVAQILHVSKWTVKRHVQKAKGRLGAETIYQTIARAVAAGFVVVPM